MMSDEFEGLLSDREFLAAVERLEEAVSLARDKRRIDPTMRRLELATRKFFREQESLFLRKFRAQLRSWFDPPAAEAASPHLQKAQIGGQDVDAFERHAASLSMPLREAITPAEWLAIWFEVTQVTRDLLANTIETAVRKALLAGALQTIADVGIRLSFNLANPRALAYLQNYGAARVTKIDEETRSQLKTILDEAIGNGWSYDRTAKAISDKFEQFAVGSPLEHIDSRAHLVAVTEMGDAYCEGNLIIAQQLQAAGIEMEKSWSTVGDDRVSELCSGNEAQGWIPLEDMFSSGHDRPLGHPGCRCDLLTRRVGSGYQ